MATKTIEKLAHQLFATRECLKRFKNTEEQISAELKPLLAHGQKLSVSGLDVELVQVESHTVPSYTVSGYDKVTVNLSRVDVPAPRA